MKKIIAIVDFSWAHRGIDLQTYAAGEVIETADQDLIDVSKKEGWASADGKLAKAEKSKPQDQAAEPGQNA